jgi:hypothetical protein
MDEEELEEEDKIYGSTFVLFGFFIFKIFIDT